MNSTVLAIAVAFSLNAQVETVSRPGEIQPRELKYQQEVFQQWWGTELERRLDELPAQGSVPEFRIPYSGHDYPDRAGGTMRALSKYDEAFNNGRFLATEHERHDVRGHRREREFVRFGLFRRFRDFRDDTPGWYGHCNGWTAAAIRHAEPKYSVRRNGVLFTPADIKGLLAEIYMYNQTEFLGGVDTAINPAVLHLTFTNWIGRGEHPVGMETAVGEVVINYPVHSYKTVIKKRRDSQAEVQMWIKYAMNTNYEPQRSPRVERNMYFHYLLDLDSSGNIVAGRYLNDSARIDMLWSPLQPVQGGERGNERGNPYVDVKEVLAIWRASVPKETREKWLNIDPTEEDRVLPPEDTTPEISPDATPDEPDVAATENSAPPAEVADPTAAPPMNESDIAASESTESDSAPAAADTAAEEEANSDDESAEAEAPAADSSAPELEGPVPPTPDIDFEDAEPATSAAEPSNEEPGNNDGADASADDSANEQDSADEQSEGDEQSEEANAPEEPEPATP